MKTRFQLLVLSFTPILLLQQNACWGQISSKAPNKVVKKAMKATPHNIVGTWSGTLVLPNSLTMPLVFRFAELKGVYSGSLESPSQSSQQIDFDSVGQDENGNIHAKIAKLLAEFSGHLEEDGKVLKGTWTQNGQSMPASFKSVGEYSAKKHAQEPIPPFPYSSEDISFKSGDHQISGTITFPRGASNSPAIVLIHGSGPHDRDENILGHKPFLVLADHLTKNGIAVLRYDKRGCKKSTGNYSSATSADFADDAVAAVEFLKTRSEIDQKHIGLLGHSEGGVIAPMVANRMPNDISFVVLMAGSALTGEKILLGQVRALSANPTDATKELTLASKTYEILKAEPNNDKAMDKILLMRKEIGKDDSKNLADVKRDLAALTSPWYRYFISYDPSVELSKLKSPVLAINGDKDKQVLADENLARIKECLQSAGNTKVRIEKIPNTNHLMQTCATGMPQEYSATDETISPAVLKLISDWIKAQ